MSTQENTYKKTLVLEFICSETKSCSPSTLKEVTHRYFLWNLMIFFSTAIFGATLHDSSSKYYYNLIIIAH